MPKLIKFTPECKFIKKTKKITESIGMAMVEKLRIYMNYINFAL